MRLFLAFGCYVLYFCCSIIDRSHATTILENRRADQTRNSEENQVPLQFNSSTPRPLKSYEKKKLLLTDEDLKAVRALQKYFLLRDECNFEPNQHHPDHGKLDNNNQAIRYCPSTADYLTCFPSTRANQTLVLKCPFKQEILQKNIKGKLSRKQR